MVIAANVVRAWWLCTRLADNMAPLYWHLWPNTAFTRDAVQAQQLAMAVMPCGSGVDLIGPSSVQTVVAMNTELFVQNPAMLAVCGMRQVVCRYQWFVKEHITTSACTLVQAHCSGYRISVDLRCAHCRLYFN